MADESCLGEDDRQESGVCELHPEGVYEREDGYFIGAIYINMTVTLLSVVLGYYAALWLFEPKLSSQIIFWGLFSAVFPVLFFRTTRGLWVNFDYYITGKSGSHERPDPGIMKEGK